MVSFHLLENILLTFLLSAYFPINYAQQGGTTQPEVTISQGTLQGIVMTTRNNRSISGFLGIPYAKPPTGDLRFANPMAADGWSGTQKASTDGNMCPQISSGIYQGEEDCLYINVYTPRLPQTTNSALLPVMVYIHGGAFLYGSSASTEVGPQYLLDEDVVFVAMNYRLGSIGFLSTGDEVASGNWGLKDQVLALEWVQDNIHYFGGDPDQVTLFGESAGAASVHLLTLANETIGLFHRYITESGSALATWAYRPRAAYSSLAFELGQYVGCSDDTSDSLIACLRTADVSDIIAMQSRFAVSAFLPDVTWGPTDEPDMKDALLTDSPTNLFAAGEIRDLPWISGVVRDEGLVTTAALYRNEDMLYDLLDNIDSMLPNLCSWEYESNSGAAWVNATKSYYLNGDKTSNASALLTALTTLVSDCYFYYPAHNALQQQYALAKNPQYFYTFNYRGSYSHTDLSGGSVVNYGVCHADDLWYLFPEELLFLSLNGTRSETDYEMVDTMIQLWTSFAINGIPTTSTLNGAITWEAYSSEDNYLRIGNESDVTLEIQYSFFTERMQFWASLYVTADEADAVSEDSSAANCLPNLLIALLLACPKFFLSGTVASILG